jgi:all-trans-retinol dehydrogenase (NAD+)
MASGALIVLGFIWQLIWVPIATCGRTFALWLGLVPFKDISGEIVLITGAASGIGRLMAFEFAKRKATVVLWDINEEANEVVANEIQQQGLQAYSYSCDVSKREEIYKVARRVTEEVGDVTILVNNAGIGTSKSLLESPDNLIQKTMDVNALAHIWLLKAFLPKMMESNHGHIVTIASAAGLFGVNSLLPYCASKFAAIGIAESLGVELAVNQKDGIRTTCVCPYYINTGMFEGASTRFPHLLPIVTPEYAVEKIMEAVLTDEVMLIFPRLVYLIYMVKG